MAAPVARCTGRYALAAVDVRVVIRPHEQSARAGRRNSGGRSTPRSGRHRGAGRGRVVPAVAVGVAVGIAPAVARARRLDAAAGAGGRGDGC